MADERVKLGVELDFTSNLAAIQKQLQTIIDGIEADNLNVSLGEQSKKELLNDVKALNNAITQSFNTTTQKINFNNVRKELGSAGVSAASLTQKLQLIGVTGEQAFNAINSSVYSFEKRIKSTNALYNKFATVLTNVSAYNMVSGAWNRVVGSIEQAIGFTKDLDRSLNDIRIVSGASADEMERFAKQANESAKALKTSTVEYSDAALVYFQQGMEADDVKKMTDATIMGANIVGESTEEMSELLTAVMNGYKLAADDAITVTDKLAAVGADTAADFYELATGMSKVASMANVAGVDLDSLNAQLATIVSVTKEAPESVGTSLKTIYSRMLAFKNNQTDLMTDDNGELFDMPSVESALEKYSKATGTQISLFETAADGTKQMRDLGDVIDDIGDSWDKTSNLAVKFGLTTSLAGERQQNRLIALFDSWEDYRKAVQTSLGAEGTTLEQNAIYMDSYAAHAKEMQSSMESLYMALFQSDDMIGIVDVITTIVNGLTKVTDLLGGLPGILSVIVGFASKPALNKLFTKTTGNLNEEPKLYNLDKVEQGEDLKTKAAEHEKEFQNYRDKLAKISKVYGEEEGKRVTELAQKYIDLRSEIEQTKVNQQYFAETQSNNEQIIKQKAQDSGMTDAFSVYKKNNELDNNTRELVKNDFQSVVDNINANSNNGQASIANQAAIKQFQKAIDDSSLSIEELQEKYNIFLERVNKNSSKAFNGAKESLDNISSIFEDYSSDKSKNVDIDNLKEQFKNFKATFEDDEIIKEFFNEFDTLLTQNQSDVADLSAEWEELLQKINDYQTEKQTGINADINNVDLKNLEQQRDQAKQKADDAIEPEYKKAEAINAVSSAISTAIPLVVGFNTAFEEGTTVSEKLANGLPVIGAALLENVDAFAESATRVFIDTKQKIKNGEANNLLSGSLWQVVRGQLGLTASSIKAIFSLNNLKAAALGAAAGLKAMLAAFLPGLILSAAITGITKLFGAIKDALPTLENARKAAEESAKALEEVNSKIDDLTSTISDLKDQIADLDPITDAKEIEQLNAQLTLTKAQLQAEEQLAEIRKKQAEADAKTVIERSSFDKNYEKWSGKSESESIQTMSGIYDYNDLGGAQTIEELNGQIDLLKTKLEGISRASSEYMGTSWDIHRMEKYRDDFYKVQEGLLSDAEEIIQQYAMIPNPTEVEIQKYQKAIDFLNSQDPSTFLKNIFNEDELTQAIKEIGDGVTDFSSIFNKHRTELNEAGVDYDKLVGYLQTYADQLAKTEEVEETAEQQFSNIINTIELLGGQLDNGELDIEEYVTNVVANLNKLSNIDLSGVTGANDSLVSVLEDVQSALDVLNSKYASGEMKTEDYNDSVVEIIQQLKTLKTLFPQLSDAIDEMLSKDFNMDKFGVLVAADEVADQWAHVNDVLDSVSDEFSNLATVQEMVADGLTLTCDEVLKLAKLYPELLQNAVVASDGQMTLNQQVYDQFIKTRQGMLDATIEEQIGELEAQNVILENKKASLKIELDAFQKYKKGEITLEQLYATTTQNLRDTLSKYLINLGVSEQKADDAIRALEEDNYSDYVKHVGQEAANLTGDLAQAYMDAATSSKANAQSQINQLAAIGQMINKIANAYANMPNGQTSDVEAITVTSGAIDALADAEERRKQKQMYSERRKAYLRTQISDASTSQVKTDELLKKYEEEVEYAKKYSTSALEELNADLDTIVNNTISSLQAQIASIENEITQNNSAINALKAVGNYVKKGVFTKEDAKKVEEYTVKVEALRKELEKLEAIAAKIALLKSMIDSTDDSETKIALTKQLIELYKEEQNALHEANEAGRASIKEGLAALAKWGITSTYDPNTNSLSIDNWEDVNTLIKDEDQRKAAETIYNSVTSTNDANASRSNQWWTDRSNIQDEFDNWVTYKKEALDKEYAHESKLRDMDLKDFRQYYDECKAIYDEALAAGYLTAEEYADKLMTLGDDYGDKVKERIDDLIKYGQTTNTLTDDEELGLYEQGKEEILALYKEGKITYAKAKELILDYMDEIADKAEEIFDKSQTEIDRMIAKLETFSGTQLEVLDLYKQKMSEIEQEANAAYASGDQDRFNDLQADYYSTKSALMSATKSMLQTVVDAVVYELDEQIDKLNDEKDALETIYDLQDKLIDLKEEYATADGEDKDFLKEKIDYLEEQIQIYNNLETIEEKMLKAAEIEKELGEITLQQLKQKLELTKKTYTQRVWHEDTGWQWEADPTAVANAEKAVKQQEQNLAVMAIQDEIDALEDYKEKWQEVLEEYEHAQDVMIATAVLGEDWCNAVLSMETGLLDSFASYAVDMCTVVQSAVMSVWETFGSLSTGLEDLALETETATTSARELPDRFYNEDGSWNYNLNLSDEMINDPYGEGYTDYQKELINSIRIEKILNDPTVDQTKYGGDVNWTTYDEASENIKKRGYAAGGVVTETDLAMLHGSPDSPEIVFNAADSKKLYDLVHSSNNLVQDLGVSLPDLLGDITKVTPNFGSIINPSVAGTGLEGSAGGTTNDESMQFSNCSFNFETGADNIGELIQDIKIRIKNR